MDNADVNDRIINSINEKLDNLDRKIDRFFESHIETRTKLNLLEEKDRDKETRIRELETQKNKILGIAIVLSFLIPIVTTLIVAGILNAIGL